MIWEKTHRREYEVAKACRLRPYRRVDADRVTGAKPRASVMALDKQTGKEVWKALDDSCFQQFPHGHHLRWQAAVIVWSDNSITSLDPANGTTYWREPMTTSNK